MKNYYDTKQELEIAKYRLSSLEERKELLYVQILGGTSKQTDVKVNKLSIDDKMSEYLIKTYELDRKIESAKNEVGLVEYTLKKMELAMREMKEIENKIFVMRFIDGLKVYQIARKIGYSKEQTYRIIKNIKQTINMTQNDTNNML